MKSVLRVLLATMVAATLLVLPWDAAVADSEERGRGREDPPGQSRRDEGNEEPSEDPADEESDDEDASSDRSDDAPAGQPGEPREPAAPDEGSSSSEGGPAPRSQDATGDQGGSPASGVVSVEVGLSASAAPTHIADGELSTITVLLTVAPGASVDRAGVLVDLPAHLTFRTASHTTSAIRGPLRFDLGPREGGSTTRVWVVVEGRAQDDEAQQPVRIAGVADDVVLRDDVSIQVGDQSESVLALTQAAPLLVQVGDSASFSLTLRNDSHHVVEDAVVVAEIAPELDVVGVAPIPEAEAIQLGRSAQREDIVWTFETLSPGQEILLPWSARAVVAGDLEATTSAEAGASNAPATSVTQATYLGYVQGVRTTRGTEPPSPRVEERIVTKLVPVTRTVSASAAAPLPITGATPAAVLMAAFALIAVGSALVLVTHGSRARTGVAVALIAVILTASGCISDSADEDPADPRAEAPAGTAPGSPAGDATGDDREEEEEEEDRVLGLRIERDPEEAAADAADPTTREIAAPADEIVTEVVFQEVTTITEVLVGAPAPAPETLGSRDGDNTVSLRLGADGATITSSRMVSLDQTEELLVSASEAGEAFSSTVLVRNLADRALIVRGTLVLDTVSSSGAASELTSAPVDVVLQPGGETSAEFTFSLPPGEYGLTGAFRPY